MHKLESKMRERERERECRAKDVRNIVWQPAVAAIAALQREKRVRLRVAKSG
jgi:hypothetical protein